MKAFLAAALLALASLPVMAQEPADGCYTPARVAADVAKVPNAKEIITLRSVDIGFEELADVIIWGDGSGHYLSVAFVNGCSLGTVATDATCRGARPKILIAFWFLRSCCNRLVSR